MLSINHLKKNIGATPVINYKKELSVILSESDIKKRILNFKSSEFSKLSSKAIMTIKVFYYTEDVLSDKLMELMTSNKIRHIPIVKNKIPIGIVSIGDVVNRLIEKVEYENQMLKDFISG